MSLIEIASNAPEADCETSLRASYESRFDRAGRPLSGVCGDFMYWEMLDWSTLLICGDGEMDDFSYDAPPPWSRHEISSVIIAEGVQTIGAYAFSAEVTAIRGLELIVPSSLRKVGAFAFSETFVDVINFPDDVDVDPSAFFIGF